MTPRLSFDWCEVPAGEFTVGTASLGIADVVQAHSDLMLPRDYFAKEAPAMTLVGDGFLIARVPVTVGQWRAVMGSAPGCGFRAAEFPVDEVSWRHAIEFCERASDVLGYAVRLPTEHEWEHAARGDDGREYPWGEAFSSDAANFVETGLGAAAPVGSFPSGASPYGVLDLAGNVDEWTSDVYSPYPGAPTEVPATEPWAVDPHVTRGGSFKHHRDLARCARRHGVYPPAQGAGIRLVTSDL